MSFVIPEPRVSSDRRPIPLSRIVNTKELRSTAILGHVFYSRNPGEVFSRPLRRLPPSLFVACHFAFFAPYFTRVFPPARVDASAIDDARSDKVS